MLGTGLSPQTYAKTGHQHQWAQALTTDHGLLWWHHKQHIRKDNSVTGPYPAEDPGVKGVVHWEFWKCHQEWSPKTLIFFLKQSM